MCAYGAPTRNHHPSLLLEHVATPVHTPLLAYAHRETRCTHETGPRFQILRQAASYVSCYFLDGRHSRQIFPLVYDQWLEPSHPVRYRARVLPIVKREASLACVPYVVFSYSNAMVSTQMRLFGHSPTPPYAQRTWERPSR